MYSGVLCGVQVMYSGVLCGVQVMYSGVLCGVQVTYSSVLCGVQVMYIGVLCGAEVVEVMYNGVLCGVQVMYSGVLYSIGVMCVLGMLAGYHNLCQYQHTRRNKNAQLHDFTQFGTVLGLHQDTKDVIKTDTIAPKFLHAPDFRHQRFKCF
jgi:hypothetical protein